MQRVWWICRVWQKFLNLAIVQLIRSLRVWVCYGKTVSLLHSLAKLAKDGLTPNNNFGLQCNNRERNISDVVHLQKVSNMASSSSGIVMFLATPSADIESVNLHSVDLKQQRQRINEFTAIRVSFRHCVRGAKLECVKVRGGGHGCTCSGNGDGLLCIQTHFLPDPNCGSVPVTI